MGEGSLWSVGSRKYILGPVDASLGAGATKPEQPARNVQAGAWKLTADAMAEVDRITRRPE